MLAHGRIRTHIPGGRNRRIVRAGGDLSEEARVNRYSIRHVLAPTDLTDSGIPALRFARLFADRADAKLTVMYTDPLVYPIEFVGSAEPMFLAPTPEHEAELRESVARHIAPIVGDGPHDVLVTTGQPVPALLQVAREQDADLIVMGTHARRGWRRAILGSVSEGVVHGSNVPVLTVSVRDHMASDVSVTRIVCPVNLTEVAHEALRVAASIAEMFGAELYVVHVVEPSESGHPYSDENRVRRWIEPALQDSVTYQQVVVRGGAAERVLDTADELKADLLVVGAQHRMFRDTTVVGTTTERLIRFASCPVLMVPRTVVKVANSESVITEEAMS